MRALKNLAGMRFGRLTVQEEFQRRRKPTGGITILRRCICDCGKESWVCTADLTSNHTRSCGCLNTEILDARRITHGLTNTREYAQWANMIQRCNNPNNTMYRHYGGREDRPIKVTPEWMDFSKFFADMGPSNGLTIERLDNSLNYSPANCKWETRETHSRNKRTTVRVSYQGEIMCLLDACKKVGVEQRTIGARMRKWHYTFEEALQHTDRRQKVYVMFQGNKLTLSDACKLVGVSYDLVYARVRSQHLTFEEALKGPAVNDKHKRVMFQNRRLLVSEACKLAGVTYNLISGRMRRWHCSFEEALAGRKH